jgi:hypothetical protein
MRSDPEHFTLLALVKARRGIAVSAGAVHSGNKSHLSKETPAHRRTFAKVEQPGLVPANGYLVLGEDSGCRNGVFPSKRLTEQ